MFTTIENASRLRFSDDTPVTTPNRYINWLRERGVTYAVKSIVRYARINHGRWVTDCPCGQPVLTHPDWHLACCGACGSIYSMVVFPDRWERTA